ncbi:MAG TPA: hypothetical protein VKM55_30965 [Candidatus Lokiarchaeia archaeon]|nr:hypothetical protein [Candidatus Lokiarchaeia archaeon]
MIPEEKLDELFHSMTMTDNEKVEQLQELIDKYDENESDYLDWKIDEPKNKPLWVHLASMSFRGHGYIIIGVSDEGNIYGVDKDKIKGMIKSIEDIESSGCLGVYSWNGDKKIKDVVKIYPRIRVTPFPPPPHPSLIPNDVYLQVFEIISESAFIWSGKLAQPIFWKRGGSSSIGPCNSNIKEFLDQVIWKYDRGEKQRKIQKCFDDILDHVRFAIFDNYFKNNQETYWFNLKRRIESIDHKMLKEDMELVYDEQIGISITMENSIWHIPWRIRIALWDSDCDDNYITRESRDKGNGRVQSMMEIREFFQEYSQSLTNRFHVKINFDENKIPLERDIKEMIESDEKLQNFPRTKDSKRFIEYISEVLSKNDEP